VTIEDSWTITRPKNKVEIELENFEEFLTRSIMLSLTFVTAMTLTTIGQSLKKCDGGVVTFTKEKVGQLTQKDVRAFLMTFGKECKNNVEFGEYSNEVLFLIMDKQTKLIVQTIEKVELEIDLDEILDVFGSPINDGIDVKSLIPKVEQVKFNRKLKSRILNKLRLAEANSH
jgi:hypothetical protein